MTSDPPNPPPLENVIVLAAGVVPPSMVAFVGRTSSAMQPINGRPTIHWLLAYLRDIGVRRVILGIRQSEARLPRFVRQSFGAAMAVEIVPISEDLGPGFTLLTCLHRLPTGVGCLVVLGDTLFQFSEESRQAFAQNFVLTATVQDSSRWCLAEVDGAKQVARLADKPEQNPDTWPALIGVYHLANSTPAQQSLQRQLDAGVKSLQLRHALQPYIDAGELRAYPAGQWFDCGNLDLLASSRRRLLQSRSFNSIQIDELRGTLTKRSQHAGKFLNEINYYRLLPRDLVTFFPRLVDFSLAPKDTWLTLEYYGYPTLSEIWVFEEFEAQYWEMIFQSLARIIECFSRYTVELSSRAVFHFYWNKTVERLAAFAEQDAAFARLVEAPQVTLDGRPLKGWRNIQAEVEKLVNLAAARATGQIIHGDLCFPNILYDPVSRIFKFIDPRGSFAESGIFGDVRYDLAKLLQSVDGGYDLLVHDMFVLKGEGVNLELQQFFPEVRPAVLGGFARVFGGRHDLRDLRLLEGLLFLSMCPLHQDNARRQTAMFAIGLRILNEVLNDEDMH